VKILKRELFVFFILFILLSLSIHYKEWFIDPIGHISSLSSSPLGLWHPFVLTLVVYVIVLVVRVVIHLIRRFQARKF
jgi:hypothetical protein